MLWMGGAVFQYSHTRVCSMCDPPPQKDILVFPCSFFVPFSFVLSYRFPVVSCIAFFAFLFASPLSLVGDCVFLFFRLGATPPPPLLASLKYMRIPFACRLLALLMLIYFHVFFSSFAFSILIWTSFVSSCLFLAGTMLSPRFRFLLRLL